MPKPLSVIGVARLLLSVFVPPSLMVCAVSGLEKEMAALLVKLIAPVPDEFSLLVADGPSVNWRSVLPPVPIYCSVPPFNTRLLATEPDAPIELFDPPLSRPSSEERRVGNECVRTGRSAW